MTLESDKADGFDRALELTSKIKYQQKTGSTRNLT